MASAWRNFKNIFFLPYVLDLMDLLEQKFCRDSNLRVKLMYESVKLRESQPLLGRFFNCIALKEGQGTMQWAWPQFKDPKKFHIAV